MRTSLLSALRRSGRKIAGSLLAALVLSGMTTSAASASNAAFNNLPTDVPTLQVAVPSGTWQTQVNQNAGHEVVLYIYDHNTAADGSTCGIKALNTTLKITNPDGGTSTTHTLTGTVSADNAAPVSSNVTVTTDVPSKLSVVSGTGVFLKNVNGIMTQQQPPAGVNLDDVVNKGVNLGDQCACFQYIQGIMIKLLVEGGTPAVHISKQVALAGAGATYQQEVDNVQPGDAVEYNLFLQNTGDGNGDHPVITDKLDSRLRYMPGTTEIRIKVDNQDKDITIPDPAIAGDGTLTWDLSSYPLGPIQAMYLRYQARVATADQFQVGDTEIDNCAAGSFTGVTPVTTSPCAIIKVHKAVAPFVTLHIQKLAQNLTEKTPEWFSHDLAGSARPGDLIAYKLTVENDGNVAASNVKVQDLLPPGAVYQPGSARLYTVDDQTVGTPLAGGEALVNGGYVFPTIDAGTRGWKQIVFNATLAPDCSVARADTNTATASSGSASATDSVTMNVSCVHGLLITKLVYDPTVKDYVPVRSSQAPVHEGDTLSYRIIVTNNGDGTDRHPLLRDVLPAQVQYDPTSLKIDGFPMSDTRNQNDFVNAGIILTDLAPGQLKQIDFNVVVVQCPTVLNAVLTNRAYVQGSNEPAELSASADATLQVRVPNFHL